MRAALVQHLRARPTPRVEFGSLHETLIIASVATVLVIRPQLWLTHYPQLGGHGLHIAPGNVVTEDNNHFYPPAAALIYFLFVALRLPTRAQQRRERGDSARSSTSPAPSSS
jgi:hypothetical protein